MTPDLIELGKRAVACKGWRWMAGMEVRRWDSHLVVWKLNRVSVTADRDTFWRVEGWVPSMNDPATLGCLLALVREAWGDGGITTQDLDGYDAYGWVCVVDTARLSPGKEYPHTRHGVTWFDGVTEAEALVVALEAAP